MRKLKTRAMEEEDNAVSIEPHYNPDPLKQENFTVICYRHHIHTVVRRWVGQIRYRHRHQLRRGRLVVGLGVQWTPSRYPHPATLQLCVGHRCLIFQLIYSDRSPNALHRLLCDPDAIFVGIWNHRDAQMLRDSRHDLRVRSLVDVREAANEIRGVGLGMSMERLAVAILGMDGVVKDESVARSDWEIQWLTEDQVEYACIDAFMSFLIAKELKVWKWKWD